MLVMIPLAGFGVSLTLTVVIHSRRVHRTSGVPSHTNVVTESLHFVVPESLEGTEFQSNI